MPALFSGGLVHGHSALPPVVAMVSSPAWSHVCTGEQGRPRESITACGDPAPPAGRGATYCPVEEQESAETAPDTVIKSGNSSSAPCLSSRVAVVTHVKTLEIWEELDWIKKKD